MRSGEQERERVGAVVRVTPGAYLASERELFRVEHVGRHSAVIEDCLNGDLIDVPLEELAPLRPVAPGA